MGDSGGPLTVEENGKIKLIGNVSWGTNRCNIDNWPSVYSRNSDLQVNLWIKQNAQLDY